MKSIAIFFSAAFLSLFMLSCDKADNYKLSARVDGDLWVSEGGVIAAMGSNAIVINGQNPPEPVLALSITDYAAPGTYALDSITNGFKYGGYFASASNPGTITITEYSASEKFVAGTFSLIAYSATDSVWVTEGKFDINYQ